MEALCNLKRKGKITKYLYNFINKKNILETKEYDVYKF